MQLFCIAVILISVHCAQHNQGQENARVITERLQNEAHRFHCPCGLPIYGPLRLNFYRPYWARDGHVVSSIIHHSLPQYFGTILSVDPALCSYSLYKFFYGTGFQMLLVLSISVADLIIRNITCIMDILAAQFQRLH